MSVRAKLKCMHKDGNAETGGQVKLEAVYDGTDANSSWSKYTPNAQFAMYVTNPPAWAAFEVGKKYFVDFTEVEEDAAT